MKIFLDTEFTGLHQQTTLISLGIVAENGKRFYAEFNDFNADQINEWIRTNVLPCLRKFSEGSFTEMHYVEQNELETFIVGNTEQIASLLTGWLESLDDTLEVWGDCMAYDWVLFCNLFGGALNVPGRIYYLPFDLVTLLKLKGIDPDISREEFAVTKSGKHHALYDAMTIQACYNIAISI